MTVRPQSRSLMHPPLSARHSGEVRERGGAAAGAGAQGGRAAGGEGPFPSVTWLNQALLPHRPLLCLCSLTARTPSPTVAHVRSQERAELARLEALRAQEEEECKELDKAANKYVERASSGWRAHVHTGTDPPYLTAG